jgi:hypothetical protein
MGLYTSQCIKHRDNFIIIIIIIIIIIMCPSCYFLPGPNIVLSTMDSNSHFQSVFIP